MENLFNATILVSPEDHERFRIWAKYYGMTVKPVRPLSNYFSVSYADGADLYWLGANMFGRIETSALTQHGPGNGNQSKT